MAQEFSPIRSVTALTGNDSAHSGEEDGNMNGPNFMQAWVALAGSLTMIALILTAFGLMLGIVKPADALRRVGAILGVVMLLMVLPAVLVNLWSGMSLWQQLALAAIVLGICLLKRPRRQARSK
jgi:hypothetical protein